MFRPQNIFIENQAAQDPLTLKIIAKFPDIPTIYVEDIRILIKQERQKQITYDKATQPLLLAHQRGTFLEKCPGTKEHICCNYYTLNIAVGCPFDCTYCFLQSYTNNPFYTIYTNIDALIQEIRSKVQKPIRIGTGEFTDSLGLEPYTDFVKEYIPKILEISPNITLELKTKSINIDFLKDFGWQKQLVIAWSVNPQELVTRDEKYATSLTERIQAAQKVQSWGYRIALHFDPIVFEENWVEKYQGVINQLKEQLNPTQVAWISLGCFRFTPSLKPIIQQKFPDSKIIYGELFPGADKKMRYPEPLRIKIFQQMVTWLKAWNQNIPLYLCMESPAVWQAVFNQKPGEINNLQILF